MPFSKLWSWTSTKSGYITYPLKLTWGASEQSCFRSEPLSFWKKYWSFLMSANPFSNSKTFPWFYIKQESFCSRTKKNRKPSCANHALKAGKVCLLHCLDQSDFSAGQCHILSNATFAWNGNTHLAPNALSADSSATKQHVLDAVAMNGSQVYVNFGRKR